MSTKSARTRRLPFPIFGIRLKAMLELRRMTRADLARKIGIDIRTMNHAISGQTQPWCDLIVKAAKIVDCSTDFLMGKSDETRSETLLKHEIHVLSDQNECQQKENEQLRTVMAALAKKRLGQETWVDTLNESYR